MQHMDGAVSTVSAAAPTEGVELWVSKLQGDWSGPSIASQLTRERLAALPAIFRRGKLDNMIKVRVLLGCLFLPRAQLDSLQDELSELSAAACEDEDEWVHVTATTIHDYAGQLDTAALVDGPHANALVRATLASLWAGLSGAQPPASFRPRQEVYMHAEVLPLGARPAPPPPNSHAHFTPREHDPEHNPLAPPALAALLDGSAVLGSSAAMTDGVKDRSRRRGAGPPLSPVGATTAMFRSSNPATLQLAAPGGGPYLSGNAPSAAWLGPSGPDPVRSVSMAGFTGQPARTASLQLAELPPDLAAPGGRPAGNSPGQLEKATARNWEHGELAEGRQADDLDVQPGAAPQSMAEMEAELFDEGPDANVSEAAGEDEGLGAGGPEAIGMKRKRGLEEHADASDDQAPEELGASPPALEDMEEI